MDYTTYVTTLVFSNGTCKLCVQLQAYLKKHKYHNANTSELWAALDKVSVH